MKSPHDSVGEDGASPDLNDASFNLFLMMAARHRSRSSVLSEFPFISCKCPGCVINIKWLITFGRTGTGNPNCKPSRTFDNNVMASS